MIYEKYKSQIESFYREKEYQGLQMASTRKAWQIEWLHSSKYLLLNRRIFSLWSFLELHSKVTHKEFSAVLPFCMYLIVQSQRFWLLFYSQAKCSPAWGRDALPQFCEYTPLQKWADETFWPLTTKVCAYFRQYSRKALLFPCTTWPKIAVWEFRLFSKAALCWDGELVSGCVFSETLAQRLILP